MRKADGTFRTYEEMGGEAFRQICGSLRTCGQGAGSGLDPNTAKGTERGV